MLRFSLAPQKEAFQLPDQLTYLNCAYMSPLLKKVEDAGIQGIQLKRNPIDVTLDHFFELPHQLRAKAAKLIGASDPFDIALIPSVSYGMSIVANNLHLKPHENIVVVDEQFPSNIYPWMNKCEESGTELRMVKAKSGIVEKGKTVNQALLQQIDEHTHMVSIAHVNWADGTLYDLEAIRKRCSEVNALMVIDGTQSVGALPFDIKRYRPDALIWAGYKWMLGPYSIGFAYFGSRFKDALPIEENWKNRRNSHDFKNLVNYQPAYQEGNLKFDVGEASNFILVPMMLEAINQILDWGVDNIQAYVKELTKEPLRILQEKGYHIESEDWRASHLFGIQIPKHIPLDKIKATFEHYQISVSYRGNAIRISPHVYNTPEEMEKLIDCLSF